LTTGRNLSQNTYSSSLRWVCTYAAHRLNIEYY
jgi:hypothetical protein